MKGDVVKYLSLDEFVRILPAGESHVTEFGMKDDSE